MNWSNYPIWQVLWMTSTVVAAGLILYHLPRNATWRQVLRPFRFITGIVVYTLYGLLMLIGFLLAPIVMAWEKSK